MFGITPRLDVNKVIATLFSDPSQSMQIIKTWLDGYIKVTAEKDREGDKAYRQQCMLWAEQLSMIIAAMVLNPGEHFSQLPPQLKQLIKKFYELINQFLLAEDFPKKPSSKASKIFQGILSALNVIPEVQEYEAIYFLEDLEALLTVFNTHFFESNQYSLEYEEKTISLSFEALQKSKVFGPLMDAYLWPLMHIALQISPKRLSRLKKLHLNIPKQIEYSATSSVFSSLFALFGAINRDLALGDEEASVNQLFQKWHEEEKDLTVFFEGDFGDENDSLLLILSARFRGTIGSRVSGFAARSIKPLESLEFIGGFAELTKQYTLDCKIKIEFNAELYKLNVMNALFFGEKFKNLVELLMDKFAFTQEELLSLCHDREKLSSDEQLVFLHAVYLKLYTISSSTDPNLFINFISERGGLLDLCIQHVKPSLYEPLFTQVITTLIGLRESPDPAINMKLRERYSQVNIKYPWAVDSNEVVMYSLKSTSAGTNPQEMAPASPGGDSQVAKLFKAAPENVAREESARNGADARKSLILP